MSQTALMLSNPASISIFNLDERNELAQKTIAEYARKHAKIDVAVGVAGLLPGAAIPALIAAIAAQSPFIYKPLAADLAKIYTGTVDHETKRIVSTVNIETGTIDVASEFGSEFMMQIANELVMEAGLGALGTAFIPVVGGVVGAALDYLIATMMTWRVGTMVAMYFQNGGAWLRNDKKYTFDQAKEMTGGLKVGVTELLNGDARKRSIRVDLNAIRHTPEVKQGLLRRLEPIITMMAAAMSVEQIRKGLMSQGIPVDIIQEAIRLYYFRDAATGSILNLE